MGSGGKRYRLHLIGRGAFEVQRNAKACLQRCDVTVTNMAAVFAQMGGDAVCPGGLGQQGGPQRVRFGEPGDRCDYAWSGITRLAHEDALCAALEAVVYTPSRMAA